MLGDTEAEAVEQHREIALAAGQRATARRSCLEQVWNRDLSGYDPDGPLPDVDPDPDDAADHPGPRPFIHQDALGDGRGSGGRSPRRRGCRLRGLAIDEFEARPTFVGTPAQVADALDDFVQNDGADGVIIGSHLAPTGLDEFVDKVVPLLQERGSLRAEYDGTTLRDNLRSPRTPDTPSRRPCSPARRPGGAPTPGATRWHAFDSRPRPAVMVAA